MRDRVLEHGRTQDPPGDMPERTCAVSRATLPPEDLIRFVLAPDGSIVPDLARKLPGRGVWVTCSRESVALAARKNVFARSLKRTVTLPDDLSGQVEQLLLQRACNALSLANKAGLVVAGFTKAEKVVAQGDAIALIHADDAADDSRGKLDRKYRAILAEIAPETAPEIIIALTNGELSLALGRSHVVHAALTKGGATQNFIKEAGRLRRYRTVSSGEAALPPGSGLDTEQA